MRQTLPTEPAKIAIFRALYLGDFLCAVPALTALRDRYPRAKSTLIGLPWTAELLDRFEVVDHFEEFPGYPGIPEVPYDPARTASFLERMCAERFDLAIQLHGDGTIANRFVGALGARASIGFRPGNAVPGPLSLALEWQENESEIRRWLRLAGVLGARGSERLRFPITRTELESASVLLRDLPAGRPSIGLHCGAKLQSRRWPVERFARLGLLLQNEFDASIVLTGAASEQALVTYLQARLRGNVLNLAGRTSLGDLAAVVDRLDLLVTNDTGAAHIAAARETPSIVLVGPSNPSRWAPLDRQRHRVIDGALGRVRDETSISNISVERVLSECRDVMVARRDNRPDHAAGIPYPARAWRV